MILKDDWAGTDIQPNDVVSLIGEWESRDPITMSVSTSFNLVIVHPDLLVSATAVAGAARCVRKPVLSTLVKSSSNDVTPATVWGRMLHQVMQSCLASGQWEDDFIQDTVHHVVQSSLELLVQIEQDAESAENELRQRAKGLAGFGRPYISSTPQVRCTHLGSVMQTF